jgi:hypothetical protein
MDNPYEPPTPFDVPGALPVGVRPPVVFWFRVYAGAMALLYLATAVGMALFMGWLEEQGAASDDTLGLGMVLVICVPFFLAFAVGAFMPSESWAWIYGMVLICIGLTSCLTMAAAIPLMIYWMKPETKIHFKRMPPAMAPNPWR